MEEKTMTSSGKARGGFARAESLTSEQRREIALKAAQKRWGLYATHKGNFMKEFGIDVDCYVLNDGPKTAVISKRGMGTALGYTGQGGTNFLRLIKRKNMAPYIGSQLLEKIENPVKFHRVRVDPECEDKPTVHGYDVTILIDVCTAIIRANDDGALNPSQFKIVKQAQIILNASAKMGIKALVYALSGYTPALEEVIDAFKRYITEEAKKYEKEFPRELYTEWQRLYHITPPARGKNWKEMHLTVDHIYYPLAKSNGRLLQLLRDSKEKQGDKNNKLFQFLNEVGERALRLQIGRVLGIAETSTDKEEYENKIRDTFATEIQYSLFPNYPIE